MPRLLDLDEVKPATLHDLAEMFAAEFSTDWLLQFGIFVFSLAPAPSAE